MIKKVRLIDADIATDDRGELMFSNNFDMSKIKRFYQITNFKTPFVRAWHGHKYESKYFYVTSGKFSRYLLTSSSKEFAKKCLL